MKRTIPYLNADDPFPSIDTALEEPNGLLAIGGDLSPTRLLDAYQAGIFPWFNDDQPILWWSPDPRMVMFPDAFQPSRSLRKTLRQFSNEAGYVVRADTAFRLVMEACAEPRDHQDGTWITQEMIDAYCALHARGLAHSIETWMDGELVGGLYGVALGRMFYGESMFARRTDASKIAFAHLVAQLKRWSFGMIDCQVYTDHLASLGAREIPRADFLAQLAKLIHYPTNKMRKAGIWTLDDHLLEDLQ